MMEGPCADSEEKHEPVSDIDTAAADSLKVLDLKRPIREADIKQRAGPANLVENDPSRHIAVPRDVGRYREYSGHWTAAPGWAV